MKKGIDVSKWQGIINWSEVKKDGVEFAIIREGYGKNQVDKKFEENYRNARAVGMPVGIYHYSYADSVEDAKKEAQFCLNNIKGKELEYPICFDIEDREMLKLNNQQRTDICKAFCDTIESAGYYAMIYCNLNWLDNYLIKSELSKYDLWLAQWGMRMPTIVVGMWQKSDKGVVRGITGNVDVNIAYKDYPEIMRKKGLNGFAKASNSGLIHVVKKGDTLWDLAEKYLGSGSKYIDIKRLNNLKSDTIQIGQRLKIK